MKDTKNFKVHGGKDRIACPCCGIEATSQELADVMQELRDLCGFPLYVTSGCRCRKHNKEVGGEDNSEHIPDPETMGWDIACTDSRKRFVILGNAIS